MVKIFVILLVAFFSSLASAYDGPKAFGTKEECREAAETYGDVIKYIPRDLSRKRDPVEGESIKILSDNVCIFADVVGGKKWVYSPGLRVFVKGAKITTIADCGNVVYDQHVWPKKPEPLAESATEEGLLCNGHMKIGGADRKVYARRHRGSTWEYLGTESALKARGVPCTCQGIKDHLGW